MVIFVAFDHFSNTNSVRPLFHTFKSILQHLSLSKHFFIVFIFILYLSYKPSIPYFAFGNASNSFMHFLLAYVFLTGCTDTVDVL